MSKTRHGFVPPFLEGANPQIRTGKGSHVPAPATSGTPRPRTAFPQRPRARRTPTVAPRMRILSRFRASPPHAMTHPMTTPTHHVFLSHRSADKAQVERLKEHLEAAGLSCWYDGEQIEVSNDFRSKLEAGIENSQAFVFCVGSRGVGQWQDKELGYVLSAALGKKKAIIPVLLPGAFEPRSLPIGVAGNRYADFRAGFGSPEGNASIQSIQRVILGNDRHPVQAAMDVPAKIDPEREALHRARLKEDLKAVFGGVFSRLLAVMTGDSDLRRVMIERFNPIATDDEGRALELMRHFHVEFFQSIGSFIQIHEGLRDDVSRRKFRELVASVLFLAMSVPYARQVLADRLEPGGSPVVVSEHATQAIMEILTSWIARHDEVKPFGRFRNASSIGLEVTPGMRSKALKEALMAELKVNKADPNAIELLRTEIQLRNDVGDPVRITIEERSLLEEIQADNQLPISDFIIFLKVRGTSIRSGVKTPVDSEHGLGRYLSVLKEAFSKS